MVELDLMKYDIKGNAERREISKKKVQVLILTVQLAQKIDDRQTGMS